MILNGEDVSEAIRLPEISACSSVVSAIPEVRAFLLQMQRDMAKKQSVIMDGRDIGTVVLPDAEVKIFLTADPQKRAERRYKELKEKGSDITLQQVLDDMAKRDASDRGRKTAPLKKAEDAVEADTSALTLDESFQLIKSIIEEKVPHEN
jgi:cytidylate kinase